MRGTPYNTGEVLRSALELGAAPYGQLERLPRDPVGPRRAAVGDLEITNRFSRQSYPVGIVVNLDGERFIDEGADFRNYTYAKYGAEVLRQPNGVAFQVFDQRSVGLLGTIDYEAPGTTRVEALAALSEGSDRRRALRADGARVQRRDRRRVEFDPAVKDGLRTEGLAVHKSNWALPLDSPPYVAFPVTCGITFTFGGLHVDEDARVLDLGGRADPGPVRGAASSSAGCSSTTTRAAPG